MTIFHDDVDISAATIDALPGYRNREVLHRYVARSRCSSTTCRFPRPTNDSGPRVTPMMTAEAPLRHAVDTCLCSPPPPALLPSLSVPVVYVTSAGERK